MTDVKVFYIPSTKMAQEIGAPTLANMIMMGKFMKECDAVSGDNIADALKKVVSAKRADMLDINLKAIDTGYNF